MMTPQDVLRLRNRQPFVPFRVHLSDGTVYEIRHPEILAVGQRTATVVVYPDPDTLLYDHVDTFALLHITRLEEGLVIQGTGNGEPSAG